MPDAQSSARAIAYLVFDGDGEVNAAPEIRRIDAATHESGKEEQNKVAARFRHWLSGGKPGPFHHGWPNEKRFLMGYVFRWDHQDQHRRLYGFLAHPRPGLEVCVLCVFRVKKKRRTDAAVKRIVRTMSEHPEVKNAVKEALGRRRRE